MVEIGSAQSIDVSPDDQILAVASASSDSAIVILDAADLGVERWLPVADGDYLDLAFSPDGRWLAGSSRHGFLYVFDTTTWELAWEPARVHDGWTLQTEWLADGRTIATSGTDGTVTLFDVERGLVRARPLRRPPNPVPATPTSCPSPTTTSSCSAANGPAGATRWSRRCGSTQACAIVGRDLTPGRVGPLPARPGPPSPPAPTWPDPPPAAAGQDPARSAAGLQAGCRLR